MPDATERLDRVETRLDDLTVEVRALGQRMDRLEVLHEDLRSSVRLIAEVQTHHGQAIGALREEVGALRQEVGALRQEVGALRQEVGALRQEVRELRTVVGEFVGFARRTLDNHERRIATLEKRRRIH